MSSTAIQYDGRHFLIESVGGTDLMVTELLEYGNDWVGGAFADPVITAEITELFEANPSRCAA